MDEADEFRPPLAQRGSLATTRWSLIVAAGGGTRREAQEAWESLARIYWPAVFAYLRRRGIAHHEAEDLTQQFFTSVIEKQWLADADPAKGKFRSFLLTILSRFVANARRDQARQKRGGGRQILSIDHDSACAAEALATDNLTPDETFTRQWAITMLGESLRRLAETYQRRGKSELFDHLKGFLTGVASEESCEQVAAALHMSAAAVKVAISRLRARYRDALRATIAETVTDPSAIDEEISELVNSLG